MISRFAPDLGLLLAGGQSKRMGRDKAMLPWQDSTLMDHQQKILRAAVGKNNVFISGHRPGTQYIPDQHPQNGPLEGLRSALIFFKKNKLEWKRLLVLPLDMPFVTAPLLKELLVEIGNHDFVQFQNFELPFAIRNTPKALGILEHLRGNGDSRAQSIQAFLKQLEGTKLKSSQDRFFNNLNTMETYCEALSATNPTG